MWACDEALVQILLLKEGEKKNNRIIGSVSLTNGVRLWIRIRILLFSSLTFKVPTKNKHFFPKLLCLFLFEGTFTSFFKDKSQKEVTKQ
jgi:hypothetical protein